MKTALMISVLLMSLSTMAAVNCDIYLVAAEVDGRPDLTEKVLDKFEDKGYKITRIEKPSDIRDQGKVSYMSVFSDIHPLVGARTAIKLTDLNIQEGSVTSRSQSTIDLTRKPLVGSAEKSLLKAVEKSIPACI